jgi:hypothetical protein
VWLSFHKDAYGCVKLQVRLRGAEAAARREEELLAGDLELLRQFASSNMVTLNGVTHSAK